MMNKYAIVTDSTTYLPEEYFTKHNIQKISLNVLEGDKTYAEKDITNEFVLERLNGGVRLTTSQPAPGEFLAIYEELFKQGYEHIFVLLISEPLSGTHQSAKLGINMLDDPTKVHLFDSDMAAFGNEMLILELNKMIQQGKETSAIIERINRLMEHTGLIFSIENLTALIRSGRLSKAKAMIGSVLRVKPLLRMKQGKIELYRALRTHKKVFESIFEEMKHKIKEHKKLYIRICSYNSIEISLKLKEEISALFENAEITFNEYIGPVFNVHLGSKGYGISWMYE